MATEDSRRSVSAQTNSSQPSASFLEQAAANLLDIQSRVSALLDQARGLQRDQGEDTDGTPNRPAPSEPASSGDTLPKYYYVVWKLSLIHI